MKRHIIGVRTYNIGRGNLPGLLRLLDTCEILGGQQFGDLLDTIRRARRIRRKQGKPIGVAWSRFTNAGRKTPIIYDRREFRRVYWHMLLAVPAGIWLGRRGAGPDRTESKYVNRVRLKSRRNGAVFVVVNTHLIPSAWSTDGPEAVARKLFWHRQIAAFWRVISARRVPVIGMGDFNRELNLVPVPRGWTWIQTGPTHGARTIDGIGWMQHPGLHGVTWGMVTETDSDHRSPRAVFELKGRR